MGQRVVITSGKGGVGKSSVAAALGTALFRRGRSVVLIDTDAGLRCLDMILGVAADVVYNFGDLAIGRCTLDQAVLTVPGCYDSGSGLALVPAPEAQDDISPLALYKAVADLAREFDYVFLDAPAGIGPTVHNCIAAADRGLCVATPDPVSVHAASMAGRLALEAGVKDCRLIINRFIDRQTRDGVVPNIDDMIDGTGLQLLGIVPFDYNVQAAALAGKPLTEGRAAAAFGRMAARFEGKPVPLPRLSKI